MSSFISWIDFDDTDRKRMLEVVKSFRDRDTRDELGIGSIRDAFANYFFPGTSTIHTRARYFFFIPWIYKSLEDKHVRSSRIAVRARELEIQLIDALKKGGEDEGVIGKDVGDKLKILPSQIYWSALGEFLIRLFNGTREQYHRSLDSFYKRLRSSAGRDDMDEYKDSIANWNPMLPEPPVDFIEKTNFKLTTDEADYLEQNILTRHSESLLAQFLIEGTLFKSDFPWEQPIVKILNPKLQNELEHAKNFSESIHGAALLYNYMLSQKRNAKHMVDDYGEMLGEWKQKISSRQHELINWYPSVWQSNALINGQVPLSTRTFVNRWFAIVYENGALDNIENDTNARQLIHNREMRLKGNRARLENQRALEIWGGASGYLQLSYRWGNASVIIKDIIEGQNDNV